MNSLVQHEIFECLICPSLVVIPTYSTVLPLTVECVICGAILPRYMTDGEILEALNAQ